MGPGDLYCGFLRAVGDPPPPFHWLDFLYEFLIPSVIASVTPLPPNFTFSRVSSAFPPFNPLLPVFLRTREAHNTGRNWADRDLESQPARRCVWREDWNLGLLYLAMRSSTGGLVKREKQLTPWGGDGKARPKWVQNIMEAQELEILRINNVPFAFWSVYPVWSVLSNINTGTLVFLLVAFVLNTCYIWTFWCTCLFINFS